MPRRGRRFHARSITLSSNRLGLIAKMDLVEGKGNRVTVPFDDELKQLTHNAIDGLRLIAVGGTIPPPLTDSPKCARCSLVGICLPDEVNFLNREDTPPRPLAVLRDEAMPVYVQAHSAKVSKREETLEIYKATQPAGADFAGRAERLS